MALWEYKVITSGQHGFATPVLLEAHLNQLGKDEWEIIHFHTLPHNALAFTGLARRPTVRDWTLEQAAAAAAKVEAEKLRAEFAAKFQSATSGTALAEEKPVSALTESEAPGDSLRKLRDTENDNDPEALADEASGDWDDWEETADDLPTFFEAVKPHLRKNQKGVGMSVGIDYLAKRWEQPEADLVGALEECGLTVPETEETPPDYFEFEGDLYWLNRNNRGQLFLNTREKPRPVFRVAHAKKLDATDPAAIALADEAAAAAAQVSRKAEPAHRRPERPERAERTERAEPRPEPAPRPAAETDAQTPAPAPSAVQSPSLEVSSGPVPEGAQLLAKIRPLMRRNRRGPGWSGSTSFLARALKLSENDLTAALAALGFVIPEKPSDKPVYTEIAGHVYWLNKDGRGGIWINGRERREGAPRPGSDEGRPETSEVAETSESPALTESLASTENLAPTESAAPAESPVPVETSAVAEIPAETEIPVAPRPAPIEHPVAETVSEIVPEPAPVVAEPALFPLESEPAPAGAPEPIEPEPQAHVSDDDLIMPAEPSASPLSAVRLLLTPNKRGGGFSGEIGDLARALDKSEEELLAVLIDAGLAVPADSEEKPVLVEHDAEILWLNKNAKDGALWLNAKLSRVGARRKSSGGEVGDAPKPRALRRPKKDASPETTETAEAG